MPPTRISVAVTPGAVTGGYDPVGPGSDAAVVGGVDPPPPPPDAFFSAFPQPAANNAAAAITAHVPTRTLDRIADPLIAVSPPRRRRSRPCHSSIVAPLGS